MVTRLRVPVGAPGALTLFGDKPGARTGCWRRTT